MSEELGTVPLATPTIDPEKLLDYIDKLDGVAFAVVSREGLPVYIRGQLEREQAEALAALGEEAFRRIEDSFGRLGSGRVTKLGLDMAQGRLYVSRLDGGVIIYQASPRLADLLAEVIERLKDNRPVKCGNCGHDVTLATYKCPRCNRTVPFVARECPHCGANIDVKRCPNCGSPLRSDGSIVKPPKEPVYIGYGASVLMFGIGGLALALGVPAAGVAAIAAGVMLALGTTIIVKRSI
ncbi:hypothetical protein Pyrfu_1768 [Pyrolobus fumarii 1A]|uniref:Roadblock/LAMTOR2 domain-containing protein n=1 Tax=Pyrolobus fumarii (strain DSM 11204 / 1A) TaxID=694429 RepID=G0ECQ2_PYRF1|nr:zinc ribbon domain-containing protein [Pyrolobus fumarii]AEM39622.1 hypothetical protein Pyrfu_1768 [Pyrolobus fumarii 1A]